MQLLKQTIESIGELNSEVMKQTRYRVDHLVKPPGSLGRMEDLAVHLAGITNNPFPEADQKVIIVMSADHGVYAEGVAPNDQIITAIQTPNFVRGVTGVCAFAKQARADVVVVDVGVAVDLDAPGVINRKIRYGTDNMAKGPAMSRDEAIQALEIGIEITSEQIRQGKNLIGTGEMGISNTTASAAILSVLGAFDPSEVVGIGAGLSIDRLSHKADVIRRAIACNRPNPKDGIDVLAKVGGFEIGGMAGTMLAAAAHRVPVVVDGFISTAAALIAVALAPKVKNFLIPSHSSAEKGAAKATALLGLKSMFDMDLRLGEGSGAALAFNFVEAATYMVREMVTLEEAGITL
ncbi:nicotinate-nucleotide--dimethylbenzimidazole phosphoribosyltransferase [Geosporobacter ferrireducens]|uniref:Nicotinate-nucleotide--dimethylbenzimidazole phosphoribosyltransferase n=1 Tax=Geosporobacter ferrireducens TaxID=1424294 RepID=A0A1D8GGD2_9FIRM|nr:nicotinate-nucleotide--dimethylbenzimidazole phosphoribosyltransferase [Geosporobacter ferrireducens]AOT69974.1 nicotinate-nucleotide--dimethylbenzimidazole phosphoribosyltransferase [Geosporobacter ferrireducens]